MKKRTCRGCFAILPGDKGCEFGFKCMDVVPLEECPKPRNPREYFALKEEHDERLCSN